MGVVFGVQCVFEYAIVRRAPRRHLLAGRRARRASFGEQQVVRKRCGGCGCVRVCACVCCTSRKCEVLMVDLSDTYSVIRRDCRTQVQFLRCCGRATDCEFVSIKFMVCCEVHHRSDFAVCRD